MVAVDDAGGRDAGEDDTTRIGLAGDVMLGRNVDAAHRDRSPASVWGSMYEHLVGLDGFVANLECVLSERGDPWPEKRFHFRAHPDWSIAALRAIDATALSLANNHAMDFGPAALLDTVDALDAAGIANYGAGATIEDAIEPAVFDVGDLRLGAFGLVDHWGEFAAGEDSPGVAFAELSVENAETRTLVERALSRLDGADPDLVVASLHGGYNYDTGPSDDQRAFCHWLVDRGVDIVHGHSAHIVQGVEVYDGRPIVYDAGEFVDDYADHPTYHNDRSYLFELTLEGGTPATLDLVPIEIRGYRVHRAGRPVAAALADTMRERSAAFDTEFERGSEPGVLRVALAE